MNAETVQTLKKEFKDYNLFELPRIEKLSVNAGVGKAVKLDKKNLEIATRALTLITGQKPAYRKAKKSIANFNKLREGEIVGLVCTLRGAQIDNFLTKLIAVALPRGRDFKGISATAIDEKGNLSIGIKDFKIFVEVDNEEFYTQNFSFQVNVSVKARSREDAIKLYQIMNIPIKGVYQVKDSNS
jgi:large subunit ribosomal protein L5